MSTAREAYSEDDNFLIGDDFITNRFRREARQLHLSEFPRTRREAHFARYRNSFLKCDLDQTNSRIEQGRKLRLAELERARAAVLKEDEKRRGNRRDIPMSSLKSANGSGKMSKVDTRSKGSLSGRRVTKEFQQDSRPNISVRRNQDSRLNKSVENGENPIGDESSSANRSQQKKQLSDIRLTSSQTSSKVRKDHLAGKDGGSFTMDAISRLSWTPSMVGKRWSVGNSLPTTLKTHGVSSSQRKKLSVTDLNSTRRSSETGKDDLTRNQGTTLTAPRLSWKPSVAEKRDSMTTSLKAVSLYVTPPKTVNDEVPISSISLDKIVTGFALSETTGTWQREQQDHDYSQGGETSYRMASAKIGVASPFTQSNKRTSSTSVSECGSERSLRSQSSGLTRVKKGVSPGISEYQVSNLRTAQTQSAHEKWMWKEFDKTKSRAKSEPSKNQRTRSSWNSSIHSPDSRRTKSCRSEIDMTLMSEQNREKLIEAFLPDLRKNHTRMGYLHRVRPFNLNQENLKTVQIRAKSLSYNRDLREHSDMSLGCGRKAANSTTPRPRWAVKPLPVNSANDRLCPEEPPQMVAFVKRQQWNYSDKRASLDRALPKRSLDK
ncbi:unnamed protein product [Porites evermanni]|uniref:Uncharacterized protein n=1 Tax=Porites evermanni TaxID=104178 RepID=A0ABN8NB72_9CNID|nr:unnamed protein product [Porites evermanni]